MPDVLLSPSPVSGRPLRTRSPGRRGWTAGEKHAARVVLGLAFLTGLFLVPWHAHPVPAPSGGDWPMSRYDAGRTAASPHELPARMHLQWVREYPALAPAWPDQPKLQFDAAYDPVVLGRTMFVASPRNDTVTALDTETGEELWTFAGEGPVRFAPVAWEGRVYFAADDGYLY